VVGKALSAPLATMMGALLIANIGVLPHSSMIYTSINSFIVPLTVPLLLFDSNLRRIIRETGSLLAAFFVGAVATIVGTIVAYPLIPMRGLDSGRGIAGRHVAVALAARHIGGAINFVAVADTLKIPPAPVSAAIAADNVVVALYFAFLFAISKAGEDSLAINNTPTSATSAPAVVDGSVDGEFEIALVSSPDKVDGAVSSKGDATFSRPSEITLSSIGIALATSSALVTAGGLLTKALLPRGVSPLPVTSVLTVAAATVFPRFFLGIRKAGNALGILGIQLFFAASGCAGSIRLVLEQAPSLFAFSMLQVAVHFACLIAVGKGVFRLPSRELYLASNANVGGPTTAAAMAQAKEWKGLVLPALLVGILGYSIATAVALALLPLLSRLPIFV
jgi:uncharacterized membrane protein